MGREDGKSGQELDPELSKLNPEVLKLLQNGSTIDYAGVSEGLVVTNENGIPQLDVKLDMQIFFELQGSEKIVLKGTVRQGHPLFHGRVDSYGLPVEEKKTS